MDPLLRSTLLKPAMPAAIVVLVLVVSRVRGLSWRENLGFRAPRAAAAVLWIGVSLAWMAASEVVLRAFALDQAKPWPDYPATIVALRILAIGFLGPLAEETMMRGLLLDRLRRTRLGPAGAIVITAVGWSALHFNYGPGTLVLLCLDGLLLGYVRYRTGSLWLPIAMHVLGNLVSIAQSLAG
jgi:membrane protease YdiL (CAAX protease family)